MKRTFEVALHHFSLQFPSSLLEKGLLDELSNYDPFEVEALPDGEEGIFSLSICEGLPFFKGKALLLSDNPEMPRLDLYRNMDPVSGEEADGYYFELSPLPSKPVSAIFSISGDFTKGWLRILDERLFSFAVDNALMLLFAFRTATLSTLEMHASVVENKGKGYLFLGKSGTGKSTHSSLWLRHIDGSFLLNDDNPIVRIVDGTVRVFGSPWSGKTPCYRNKDVPVGAIVRIRQAPFNKIAKLPSVGAYASLYSSCSGLRADRKISDGLHDTVSQLALGVPCYLLDCLPDEEAARVCYREVSKSASE